MYAADMFCLFFLAEIKIHYIACLSSLNSFKARHLNQF